jgi:hypothetical protein
VSLPDGNRIQKGNHGDAGWITAASDIIGLQSFYTPIPRNRSRDARTLRRQAPRRQTARQAELDS